MAGNTSSNEKKVLATFEVKMRADANREELTRLSENLHALARSTPSIGAIEASNWAGEDGTFLAMYTFKSMSALKEFVSHPAHQAVMKRAEEFFESVRAQITTVEKQSELVLSS